MNELQDLFTPHDEFFCTVCDRPYYLRSGFGEHMKNAHNRDLDGNIIDKKKDAKRRNRKKKTQRAEQEGKDVNGNSNGQVGDVDLGGGLVYADEAIWDLYAEGTSQQYYVKILALDIVNRSSK